MSIKTQILSKKFSYIVSVKYKTADTIENPSEYFEEELAGWALTDAGLSPMLSFVNAAYNGVTSVGGNNTYSWTVTYTE